MLTIRRAYEGTGNKVVKPPRQRGRLRPEDGTRPRRSRVQQELELELELEFELTGSAEGVPTLGQAK